jgi:hypothetical protein
MGALAPQLGARLNTTGREVQWARPGQPMVACSSRRRLRCRAVTAPQAPCGPQQHSRQPKQRHRHSRHVCHSFNLPDGLGENLRRLRGMANQGQQGQQKEGSGAAGQGGAADDQQQPSVWSDWQGGLLGGKANRLPCANMHACCPPTAISPLPSVPLITCIPLITCFFLLLLPASLPFNS